MSQGRDSPTYLPSKENSSRARLSQFKQCAQLKLKLRMDLTQYYTVTPHYALLSAAKPQQQQRPAKAWLHRSQRRDMFRRLVAVKPRSFARTKATAIPATSGKVTGSVDGAFEKDRIPKAPGEGNQREFTYFMLGGARFIYASAVRLALVKFVASMQPSADVLALASAEFNLEGINEGTTLTVKWRGKPVFIRHRPEAEIKREAAVSVNTLKDPQTDASRVQDPKWYLPDATYPPVVLNIFLGLSCLVYAPTSAVCLSLERVSTEDGSALAMAPTMTPVAASVRDLLLSISRSLHILSMATRSSSDNLRRTLQNTDLQIDSIIREML